jgi:hypothetical protein
MTEVREEQFDQLHIRMYLIREGDEAELRRTLEMNAVM